MSDRRELLEFLAARPLWLGMPAIAHALSQPAPAQAAEARLASAADALDV